MRNFFVSSIVAMLLLSMGTATLARQDRDDEGSVLAHPVVKLVAPTVFMALVLIGYKTIQSEREVLASMQEDLRQEKNALAANFKKLEGDLLTRQRQQEKLLEETKQSTVIAKKELNGSADELRNLREKNDQFQRRAVISGNEAVDAIARARDYQDRYDRLYRETLALRNSWLGGWYHKFQ